MENQESTKETQVKQNDIDNEKKKNICKKMRDLIIILNPFTWLIIISIIGRLFPIFVNYILYSLYQIISIYWLIWIPVHIVYLKNKWLLEEKCFRKIMLIWWIPFILVVLLFWGAIVTFNWMR